MARKIIIVFIISVVLTNNLNSSTYIKIRSISDSKDKMIRDLYIIKSSVNSYDYTYFTDYIRMSDETFQKLYITIEKSFNIVQIRANIDFGNNYSFLFELCDINNRKYYYAFNRNRSILIFRELMEVISISEHKLSQLLEERIFRIIDKDEYEKKYDNGWFCIIRRRIVKWFNI